jgi:hypothetical protein
MPSHQAWSQANMSAPVDRKRTGLFAATGDFLWFALSDGLDAHKEKYPVIDLRRKVVPPFLRYFSSF